MCHYGSELLSKSSFLSLSSLRSSACGFGEVPLAAAAVLLFAFLFGSSNIQQALALHFSRFKVECQRTFEGSRQHPASFCTSFFTLQSRVSAQGGITAATASSPLASLYLRLCHASATATAGEEHSFHKLFPTARHYPANLRVRC